MPEMASYRKPEALLSIQLLIPAFPPMTQEAEHLEVGIRVISPLRLSLDVVNLRLSPICTNSPTLPALPIVPHQDSLPGGFPVFPSPIGD